MKWIVGPALAVLTIASASAQAPVLYAGKVDLPVKAGDTVIADCGPFLDLDPDAEKPDMTGVACVRPGPGGAMTSMQHYMRSLQAAGFKNQPSNLQTPMFVFCRGTEVVGLAITRPRVATNAKLEWVDETGKPTTFEAQMQTAPIAMVYEPEGACTYP